MDDLLRLDDRLDGDQRLIRDTVRSFVADRVLPHVGDWFEEGTFPARELAPELGSLGLLGMHLEGHGCAGTPVNTRALTTSTLGNDSP